MSTLTLHPSRAPRQRFRGKRRYFRKVHREARRVELDIGPSASWDFWHYHADWRGWGNLRWSYRLEHIRAGRDHLHTPNANGSTFPFRPEDVQAHDSTLSTVFEKLLPNHRLRIGWNRTLDDTDRGPSWRTTHWICADGVGLALF